MRSRVKVVSLALGVVFLLGALGIGAVFAADPPTNPTSPANQQNVLLGKVAKILGIDEQKLTNAFVQARKEIRTENIDKALAEGRITKEMADWLKARPDNGLLGPGPKGMMGGGRRGGPMGGRFSAPGQPAATPSATR